MTKNEAINIVIKNAQLYEKNLRGKSLLFIYFDNNKIEQIEIIFSKSSFQHLTGIEMIRKTTANDFYNKCLKRNISYKDIKFKDDGTTELKLSVLEQIMNINKTAKMIGNYDFSKGCLYTEKLIGTVVAILGLKKVKEYYVPNTVLKQDIRDIVEKPNRIICIMSKKMEEKIYKEITYIAKNINIKSLFKKKILEGKIDFENLYSNNVSINNSLKEKIK